ncbi:hypothetical protein DGMP_06200 [Desulfomarina profundi]|uniref:Uncharacterized protein n=1 Tax=Desulfomarina profundi TaxID=2772557 RepID=A0A8D5FU45_9BACT|nr:hypothetical protein [Desulfomarina profundi]BCL59927.1 hypothetical protein DGMP_06200 [Desulfomarina profundi]
MSRSVLCTLFFSAIFFLSGVTGQAGQSGHLPSVDVQARFIVVDELNAEFHKDTGTITVTALIRNVSRSKIKGYATIYYLSAEGQEIYSYEEEVNEGEPFDHGVSVTFESTAKISNIDKIASISVDFTQT